MSFILFSYCNFTLLVEGFQRNKYNYLLPWRQTSHVKDSAVGSRNIITFYALSYESRIVCALELHRLEQYHICVPLKVF